MLTLLVSIILANGLPAAEAQEAGVTITGVLKLHCVEGQAWTLEFEGKTYDLHGKMAGFQHGDRVEVTGRILKDGVCIHMLGILFKVEAVKRVK